MTERRDEDTAAAGAQRDAAAGARDHPTWSLVRATARGGRRAARAVTGPVGRRIGSGVAVLLVTLVGVVLGVLLGARTESDVGPFRAELAISPNLHGDTQVVVPPLGALSLDSHDGPAHLSIRLGSLDRSRTQALINDPGGITRASASAVDDVANGLTKLGLQTLGTAVLATLVLSALVFRDVRRVATAGGLALAITAAGLGAAAATFRADSIQEPRYEGLLVNAPAVVGDARRIANRYEEYAAQLQKLVANVSRLYTTVSGIPLYEPEAGTTRVLHVSDLHLNPAAWSVIRTVVEQFHINVVIDTGDITDWGSEPEASFVGAISVLGVPYVFINGNHDSARTSAAVARQPNAVVLDNSIATVGGLTIAGIGDPRFTPDKETSPTGSGQSKQTVERVIGAGEELANTIRGANRPVDIALVHDPASAGPLAGTCPLVLAGHTHKREVRTFEPAPNGVRTRLLIEGSTGGAGLRGLEGEEPLPLVLSVLYFDDTRALQAYDDIRVGGTGQSQVTLERHVTHELAEAPPRPGAGAPTPR
ncbi:MAG TPA: metallophosphoesterase [Micromonosporaceae bacterium]|nr:metallophosphoesterase [Micromonosporaceae bacterium]